METTSIPVSLEIIENHPLGACLPILDPLLLHSFASLQKGMQALQQRYTFQPFASQQVCQSFFNNIIPQLLFQAGKTIVLEMHVARVQDRLHGGTPEERFSDFVRQLSQPEMIAALFAEYPVLEQVLLSTLNLWTDYTLETLDHLCADWQDICALFTPENEPGLLIEIQGGAGDTHRRGRNVQILTFSSGLQVLYKPKSLAIDKHFQELLAWLNEHGAQPPLRVLKLLDRGTYGWSEFVATTSCSSQDEVTRFYRRQGEYLALCYVLNMTDCHSENVIASGEYPVLVDLESLFHPYAESDTPAQPGDLALRFLNQSVLRVGLLPQWSWSGENSPGVDISGLGGQQGQVMPRPLPGWDQPGTDQMHLTYQQVEMPMSQNRPRLHEQYVHPLDYKNDIAAGFASMYRLLVTKRDFLLAAQLPRFAHDEIRVLIRPTRFYGLLLAASFHPDLLRDALERDRFFDRLWQEVENWPDLSRFIPAERRDLLRGDIPLFTTFPDSRMIFGSEEEPLFDLFKVSGLDLVQRRFQCLNESDLTRQIWIIQASLATPHMGSEDQLRKNLPVNPTRQPINRQRLISLATMVGARLEELALQNGENVSWLGVNQLREKTWGLAPAGIDLYDGAGGIILFLSYLGAVTGETRFTSLARLALAPICTLVEDQSEKLQDKNIGAFDGWGSILYLLAHLGVLWNEPALLHAAEKVAAPLPALIARDEQLDILSGSAGCILSLLGLYTVHPSPAILERAIQCGDRLLATAQAMPRGIGWQTNKQEPPLGGFSHGSSGIALSLLKLANESKEGRFRQAALAALAYERSLFVPAQRNWTDLRTLPGHRSEVRKSGTAAKGTEQRYMVAWCHGAPGIGLARLGALKLVDDALTREDIDVALNTTMEQGLTGNHSLCHGAAGNVEPLLLASQLLNRQKDRERLEKAQSIMLGSLEAHGWITGIPLGIETPGLMTGLAGIGYELLRLAEPDSVPSVLLVAPPACNGLGE